MQLLVHLTTTQLENLYNVIMDLYVCVLFHKSVSSSIVSKPSGEAGETKKHTTRKKQWTEVSWCEEIADYM